MTYSHALSYLCNAPTPVREVTRHELPPLPPCGKEAGAELIFCFADNKIGNMAARFVRRMLCAAGIGCLHWIDNALLPPKERFYQNDRPLSPPVLAAAATAAKTEELALFSPETSLTDAQRGCCMLARCARREECRVLLVQSDRIRSLLPLLARLLSAHGSGVLPPSVVAVVSDKDQQLPSELTRHTRLVITATYGPESYRRISDICVRADIRLETTKQCRRESITPGAQQLRYGALPSLPLRLPGGSESVAIAAQLAIECTRAMQHDHFHLSPEEIQTGLATTSLSHCGAPIDLFPLTVTDSAENPDELSTVLRALARHESALPRPRHLYLHSSLGTPPDEAQRLFDRIDDEHTAIERVAGETTVFIGPRAYLAALLPIRR